MNCFCSILLAQFLILNFGSELKDRGFFSTQPPKPKTQLDRDKAYLRKEFDKHFKSIQVVSQALLREHEAKVLTPDQLSKDARSINKSAKALRTMMALGALAEKPKIDDTLNSAEQFDESIRRLAKLIWDFAHNPVHQNNKVFNTDQAAKAQTDLLTIIDLSKLIENRAKNYSSTKEN